MAKTKICCEAKNESNEYSNKINAVLGYIAAIWAINHNQESITDPTEAQQKKSKLSYKEYTESGLQKYLKNLTLNFL